MVMVAWVFSTVFLTCIPGSRLSVGLNPANA
jgi:hypothetical protein